MERKEYEEITEALESLNLERQKTGCLLILTRMLFEIHSDLKELNKTLKQKVEEV